MSSESLMSNLQPSEIAPGIPEISSNNFTDEKTSNKKRLVIIIVCAIISAIIIALTITLCYVFFFKQKEPKSDDTGFEFIYINDIHLDPLYVSDSPDTTTLCRTSTGSGVSYTFGKYGCDCPESTFLSMIDFLPKASKNPKFILFGGDGPAHALGYSMSQVSDLESMILQNLSSVYPSTPILFSLGNNEYVPNYGDNNFTNDQENFESLSNVFKKFLTAEQLATFKKGGYYYQDFPEMKLRLVVMNSVIYNVNRLVLDDPYDQFKWLKEISEGAKKSGYDIGVSIHIPPGVSYNSKSPYNQGWREEYISEFDKIIHEYDIKFIISAHSHYDLIMPIYMPKGVSNAFSLSAPAVSMQHKNNPAFRVMYIKDGQISDFVQYYADLMLNPDKLDWKIEYTFSEAYNVDNLDKVNLKKVVDWIKSSGEGMWRYMEKICSFASDNGKFYYCVLTSTTSEEVMKCLGPSVNSEKDLSRFFPYGGEI